MNFRIGQEIVCVRTFTYILKINLPVKELVYIVDGYDPRNNNYVYLIGFNDFIDGNRCAFYEGGFRPLDEVLNEISIEEVFNNPIKEVV